MDLVFLSLLRTPRLGVIESTLLVQLLELALYMVDENKHRQHCFLALTETSWKRRRKT